MKNPFRITLVFTLLMTAACGWSSDGPSTLGLIDAMTGGKEEDLARARQLLPHRGIESVPLVLPLIDHPDERVWRTAYNILADIAAGVSVPGREKDRLFVTGAFLSLLGSEASDQDKEQGLRLLPLVVPEGVDLPEVAALLEEEKWREKARVCLVEIGTPQACGALRGAVRKSDAEFQIALVQALAHLEDEGSWSVIVILLSDPNPRVRAAAMRALAQTGDIKYVSPFKVVLERADASTREEANQALLEFAESVLEKAKDERTARGLYRHVLKSCTHTAIRGAAVVGLGKSGTAETVAEITDILKNDPTLMGPAVSALGLLDSEEARQAVVEAFPALPESARYALLFQFAQVGAPVYLDSMIACLGEESADLQEAASQALAKSGSPDAIEPLLARLNSANEEQTGERWETVASLLARVDSEPAGPQVSAAYETLYREATTPDQKSRALNGLSPNPTPGAADILIAAAESGEGGPDILRALATTVGSLQADGQGDKAEKALKVLLGAARSAEGVRSVYTALSATGREAEAASALGFIRDWRVGPPMDWTPGKGWGGEDVTIPVLEADPNQPIEEIDPISVEARAEGFPPLVNLISVLGDRSNASAYAFTVVESPAAKKAVLLMGSDDGIKAWVNGKVVHENLVDRGADLDQDRAEVDLEKGKNLIVVQITQGGGGWNFLARLTETDGTPIPASAKGE